MGVPGAFDGPQGYMALEQRPNMPEDVWAAQGFPMPGWVGWVGRCLGWGGWWWGAGQQVRANALTK